MTKSTSRLRITIALVYLGFLFIGAAQFWPLDSWQVGVLVFMSALFLVGVALWIAPKDARRPRGGPMIDPDKTIVVKEHRGLSDNERGPN